MNETALSLKQRFALSRFMRGEKPVNGALTLNQRRIFILPTRQGGGFIVLIVLLLLIALTYNNNLIYLLAFMLASVFFITILHTYQSLAGLVVKPLQTQAAFAGEKAGFSFSIQNPGEQERFDIQLKLETETRLDIPPHHHEKVLLFKSAKKRGLLKAGTLTVSSTYPLGLFRAWSPLRFKLEALVYPAPAAVFSAFPESEGFEGENGQSKKGGDDFYGLQSYQPGDPIRQIHWKSYAKGQGLFSKHYGGNAVADLWLNYAQTPGHDVEQRLSHLCRWIMEAEKAGLRYGLILPNKKIPCRNGPDHQHACLEALALF